MPIGCKGVCYRYQSIGGGMYSAYKKGFKWCTECSIYIKYEENRCPCCGYPLRTKRRTSRTKAYKNEKNSSLN